MNIKISKIEHERLLEYELGRGLMGSRMYGTDDENSDTDALLIYNPEVFSGNFPIFTWGLPNIHQFQYDDKENNIQYIWTTEEQFWRNLYSGDSTINVDMLLFGALPEVMGWDDVTLGNEVDICRTYKIIKAFLGFAKRDLNRIKDGKHKMFHACRSLYMADCLLENEYPTISYIQTLKNVCDGFSIEAQKDYMKQLRVKATRLYEENKLSLYYVPKEHDTLLDKLLQSNNTKQFTYG